MSPGKTVRLRRIFSRGRVLIAASGPLAGEPLQRVRLAARAGVDAVVLTPGMLENVAEDAGLLSVILRIEGGPSHSQLLSVEAALASGADAVVVDAAIGPAAFARVAEDSTRLGMPLFVEAGPPDWPAAARLAADFGADAVIAPPAAAGSEYRLLARSTGKPCLARVDEPGQPEALLRRLAGVIEAGAQGLVLCDPSLLEPPLLSAIHALVHQGVSAAEALSLAVDPVDRD